MTDFILTAGHHLLAFLLVATLATELTLTRPGLGADELRTLARVDIAYGAIFVLLVAVGVGRVLCGAKASLFFLESPLFWAKMAALIATALMSLPPTFTILRWHRRFRATPGTLPLASEIARVRHWMHGEAAALVVVPILAALMARGTWW